MLLLLGGGSGFCFWLAIEQQVGSYFILLLLFGLALAAALPWLAYRAYALLQARCTLERNGLRLRWGLRAEDIPLPQIEWVRPAGELGLPLRLPSLRWPGAILGTRHIDGLGDVEFMAAEEETLLLVATPHKIYAISPADPRRFQSAFQRAIEMGSPTPLSSFSALPAAFLQRVWADRAARILVLSGLGLTILLFLIVGLLIPGRSFVSLGFDSAGEPLPPAPPERLLLLPVLAALMMTVNLLGGLFLYRRNDWRTIAYLLWGSGALAPTLLIIAALFFSG
jgi:hypothetical protein